MAALEAAIQGKKLRRLLPWMGGSSPPMENERNCGDKQKCR
jgi:hypothetical protein